MAVRRRDFIKGIAGSTIAWPRVARAQQGERMRRIGVLLNRAADDPEGQASVATFKETLQQSGWSDGRNLRIDIRWGEDDVERERRYANELVALGPDIILAAGSVSVAALQRVAGTLPIVFVGVVDPVGAGFVDALSRPGANTTGFMLFEYTLSGKWLELLKQIAPNMTRTAVLRDPFNPASSGEFVAIQSAAQPLRVEVSPVNTRDARQIERDIAAFGNSANGGLIVTGGIFAI